MVRKKKLNRTAEGRGKPQDTRMLRAVSFVFI